MGEATTISWLRNNCALRAPCTPVTRGAGGGRGAGRTSVLVKSRDAPLFAPLRTANSDLDTPPIGHSRRSDCLWAKSQEPPKRARGQITNGRFEDSTTFGSSSASGAEQHSEAAPSSSFGGPPFCCPGLLVNTQVTYIPRY